MRRPFTFKSRSMPHRVIVIHISPSYGIVVFSLSFRFFSHHVEDRRRHKAVGQLHDVFLLPFSRSHCGQRICVARRGAVLMMHKSVDLQASIAQLASCKCSNISISWPFREFSISFPSSARASCANYSL